MRDLGSLDVDWDDDADVEGFRGFCRNATDAQLRNIYRREKDNNRPGYASIAREVAASRGVEVE